MMVLTSITLLLHHYNTENKMSNKFQRPSSFPIPVQGLVGKDDSALQFWDQKIPVLLYQAIFYREPAVLLFHGEVLLGTIM